MKINRFIITLTLLLAINWPATAQNMADMMRQQIEQTLQQDCRDPAFIGCLGISSKTCLKAGQKTLQKCGPKMPTGPIMQNIAAMEAFDQCIQDKFTKFAGISASKFDACDPGKSANANSMPAEMDPTQGLVMMKEMMQQHARTTDTSGVTLPVYKNATVMMHITDGASMQGLVEPGVIPLPALTMISSDGVEKVAAYYRKRLKGFREYNLAGNILFMKNGPSNFEILQNMKIFVTTPHVYITNLANVGSLAPPGSKSQIEIAYKK